MFAPASRNSESRHGDREVRSCKFSARWRTGPIGVEVLRSHDLEVWPVFKVRRAPCQEAPARGPPLCSVVRNWRCHRPVPLPSEKEKNQKSPSHLMSEETSRCQVDFCQNGPTPPSPTATPIAGNCSFKIRGASSKNTLTSSTGGLGLTLRTEKSFAIRVAQRSEMSI